MPKNWNIGYIVPLVFNFDVEIYNRNGIDFDALAEFSQLLAQLYRRGVVVVIPDEPPCWWSSVKISISFVSTSKIYRCSNQPGLANVKHRC